MISLKMLFSPVNFETFDENFINQDPGWPARIYEHTTDNNHTVQLIHPLYYKYN